MTIAQGSMDHDDALTFLRQASSDIADYLRHVDFEALAMQEFVSEVETDTPAKN